ncbi:hypothetical protein GM3708_3536 (plasmid) [Geminocystis sp. NIES-3708]|uniref:hypothetical protein n=1 Tax=Geminocystis sp. NIES-3708 TaxID=1615909 RepID=UPI0005FCCA6F|nr:hypothetical protein [Geminocystis sp. NIES-3708]BAQ63130.1 hypothetical protein GM3708_3536 [Geminocystis sp. NIES-3708]
MSKCSAIVYGRTYEVDFRFIALPENFTDDDKKWIENYIKVTTRTAEKLTNNPRFSIVKNSQYCVFGVTCLARDLHNVIEETKDKYDRPLYGFFGYVISVNENVEAIHCFLEPNIDLFKPLYNYILEHWNTRKKLSSPIRVSYNENLSKYGEINNQKYLDIDYKKIRYNTSSEKEIYLYPSSSEYNHSLWSITIDNILKDSVNLVSLCLNLTNKSDLENAPFLNVTVNGITSFEIYTKESKIQTEINIPENDSTGKNDCTDRVLEKSSQSSIQKGEINQNVDKNPSISENSKDVNVEATQENINKEEKNKKNKKQPDYLFIILFIIFSGLTFSIIFTNIKNLSILSNNVIIFIFFISLSLSVLLAFYLAKRKQKPTNQSKSSQSSTENKTFPDKLKPKNKNTISNSKQTKSKDPFDEF